MAATRESLERQIARAKDKLAQCVKSLDEKGVASEKRRRDPKWRELNADCRQLGRRLRAFDKIVALDQELKDRKAHALEHADEPEVEAPKAAAPKAKKKPAEGKGSGEGKPAGEKKPAKAKK